MSVSSWAFLLSKQSHYFFAAKSQVIQSIFQLNSLFFSLIVVGQHTQMVLTLGVTDVVISGCWAS